MTRFYLVEMMKLLVTTLALLGAASFEDQSTDYRLPDTVIPQKYRLEIITNLGDDPPEQFNFTGEVWIQVSNLVLIRKNRNVKVILHI